MFPIIDPTASVFELHNYEEDKDYFREEPILICRPKESVQVGIYYS